MGLHGIRRRTHGTEDMGMQETLCSQCTLNANTDTRRGESTKTAQNRASTTKTNRIDWIRQQEPLYPSHRTMARDVARLRSVGVKKFSILNSRETRDRVEHANQVDSWAPSGPPVPAPVVPSCSFGHFRPVRASTAGLGS